MEVALTVEVVVVDLVRDGEFVREEEIVGELERERVFVTLFVQVLEFPRERVSVEEPVTLNFDFGLEDTPAESESLADAVTVVVPLLEEVGEEVIEVVEVALFVEVGEAVVVAEAEGDVQVSFLTRLPPPSARIISPVLATMARPWGWLTRAEVPKPSRLAPMPSPAMVLTTPEAVTARIRLLEVSLTSRVGVDAVLSKASLWGAFKPAAAPMPSAKDAEPLPAKVDTTPPGETRRILLFPASAT